MQLDYRCYVHFRDAAAFDRALDLLTVKTTAGAFPFRKLAETFSNMKAMTKAMDTPLGQVFDTVTAPRNEQFLFIHDHYKNLQTYMAMTEEIFDELYEEDPNSFLMIADVTNFDDDSLGDVVWYYLGGKDYTRFIDPDMERHGIESSDWNAGRSAAHAGAEGLGAAYHRRLSAAEHDGTFPDGKKNVCKVRSLCNDNRS